MIFSDFNAGAKTPLSAKTLIFTSADLPSDGVVAYHIAQAGSGSGTLASILGFRVKAGGQIIIDFTGNIIGYRAWVARLSRANLVAATTDPTWTIPLYLMDAKGKDIAGMNAAERYSSQFPRGKAVQIELDFDTFAADPGVDSVQIGYTIADDPAKFYPLVTTQTLGWVASANNQRFSVTSGGLIRAFQMTNASAKVNRIKLVLSGQQLVNLSRLNYQNAQRLESGLSLGGLITPLWYKLDVPLPAAVGSSYIEGDTGASFSTSDVTCIYALVPQGQ